MWRSRGGAGRGGWCLKIQFKQYLDTTSVAPWGPGRPPLMSKALPRCYTHTYIELIASVAFYRAACRVQVRVARLQWHNTSAWHPQWNAGTNVRKRMRNPESDPILWARQASSSPLSVDLQWFQRRAMGRVYNAGGMVTQSHGRSAHRHARTRA